MSQMLKVVLVSAIFAVLPACNPSSLQAAGENEKPLGQDVSRSILAQSGEFVDGDKRLSAVKIEIVDHPSWNSNEGPTVGTIELLPGGDGLVGDVDLEDRQPLLKVQIDHVNTWTGIRCQADVIVPADREMIEAAQAIELRTATDPALKRYQEACQVMGQVGQPGPVASRIQLRFSNGDTTKGNLRCGDAAPHATGTERSLVGIAEGLIQAQAGCLPGAFR